MKLTGNSLGNYYIIADMQGIKVFAEGKNNQRIMDFQGKEAMMDALRYIGRCRLFSENSDMNLGEYSKKESDIMREIADEFTNNITNGDSITQETGESKPEITQEADSLQQA